MLTASCLKHVPTNAVKDVVMVAKDAASHRWAWEAEATHRRGLLQDS